MALLGFSVGTRTLISHFFGFGKTMLVANEKLRFFVWTAQKVRSSFHLLKLLLLLLFSPVGCIGSLSLEARSFSQASASAGKIPTGEGHSLPAGVVFAENCDQFSLWERTPLRFTLTNSHAGSFVHLLQRATFKT